MLQVFFSFILLHLRVCVGGITFGGQISSLLFGSWDWIKVVRLSECLYLLRGLPHTCFGFETGFLMCAEQASQFVIQPRMVLNFHFSWSRYTVGKHCSNSATFPALSGKVHCCLWDFVVLGILLFLIWRRSLVFQDALECLLAYSLGWPWTPGPIVSVSTAEVKIDSVFWKFPTLW